jgi:hypothetical protein
MWYAVVVRALRGLVRGARVPGGVIAQDFDLRGILTADRENHQPKAGVV